MKNFIRLVAPYFYGEQKRYARFGLIVLVILSQCSTAFGYFFIQWNRRFYDALEAHQAQAFLNECLVFVALAIGWVITVCVTKYFSQQYALKWRIWMSMHALKVWTKSDTRAQLEGSDQRIQEDLMRFTTLFERFFLECFNAVLLILLFTPLLFIETKELALGSFSLGWLLFGSVVAYTAFGMYISAKIAAPLVQIEYNNQKFEAEFRYNLVHARDGAQINPSYFDQILASITGNYALMYKGQRNFNFWQKSYDQFSFLIPFALLASNYFAGALTLGGLWQIKATFSRIRNSMAYLLDHYTEITEMVAIARRLVEFYDSINLLNVRMQAQTKLNRPAPVV